MAGRTDSDLVRELEARLSAHRPPRATEAKLFADLARAIMKRADEDFLLQDDSRGWLEHTQAMLDFVRTRAEGDILVDVSKPIGDSDDRRTIVRTCMSDQPFIVDSVRLAFEQLGLELRKQVNMVLPIVRDERGVLRSVGGPDESKGQLESLAHFEITPIDTAAARRELAAELTERLIRARAMAGDFRRMLRRLKDLVNQYEFQASTQPERREELDEARHFLEWLGQDHFVFLGMTDVGPDGQLGDRLGLARLQKNPLESSYPDTRRRIGQEAAKKSAKRPSDGQRAAPAPIHIHKTSEESRLHRRGKIDEVLVRTTDDRGRPTGWVVIHGLFTLRALQTRGSIVPLLREKLTELIRREDLTPGSFNYKALVNAFNSLPVEYLFGADVDDIRALVNRTLDAERSRRLEVHLSLGGSERSAFVFVVMPRQNFNDALRERLQLHLQEVLGASYGDHRVLISTYGVAVLHFYLTSAKKMQKIDLAALEERVTAMSATWEDRLREALLRELPRDRAVELYRRYHRAFSQRFEFSTEPEQAVVDLQRLEAVRGGAVMEHALYRDREDLEQGTMKLRLYTSKDLLLSDVMPILDNFGLRVVNSFANHARLAEGLTLTMETFRFELEGLALADDPKRQGAFLQALSAVFEGQVANDALNRVLLPAGLDWRQVSLLRSYQAYSKQLGNMTTPGSLWPVLVKHAEIVRGIVELFEARFGPDPQGKLPSRPSLARRKRCQALYDEVVSKIDRVQSFNEDRTLRIFLNLVDSTLRTSFYVRTKQYPSIAHKFDCERVSTMPERKPWREIFVNHFNLDGVHLRGGRIARGGLRWSDRPDDFRTEILGLMTTQMVKNVVIVPLGAKGGFVVKNLPSDTAARRTAGDAHYEIFIHALLDVTDNVVDGAVVPPPDVVSWDDPDPYLVVAADKGTAHLSDTANAISLARGFWLGDAFASGGSNGYDHKKLGITARGAWVSIRHLLRESGVNPQTDPFTAIGIGDLGGDVFGNGMIEHDTIKLLAAFNHAHIFLDPDPDPAESFKERKRLFRARYGGWDAYDTTKISKGGGVFDRHAKRIALSAPARKMLGADAHELSGSEIIHLILQMEVDLWYNGGIGTYVKATLEGQAAAADPANDAVRIDASQLRAKVVGEGGNLGFTQAARIEFARAGGRINTDFIDNAGGVNTSDHEVNLKILFAPQVAAGRLSMRSRNQLLREIEPTVVHDVLEAQGHQARLLSLDSRRSVADLAPFDRVIDDVCKQFNVKRSQLDLPAVREMDRRMAEGEALTRPELATLSAFVKMGLYQELLEDPALETEGLSPALHNYFPEKVRKRFAKAIDEHSLRREIALTRLTNRIVDHTGCTFFHEMHADCGASSRQTFEAYSVVSRAANLWAFKDSLWALGWKVDVDVLYEALLITEHALRLCTRHVLEHWSQDRVQETLRNTAPYSRKLQALEAETQAILDPVSLDRVRERTARFQEAGIPARMATQLAHVRYLPRALVVLDLADAAKRPAKALAGDYFAIGRASRLFDVIRRIDELRPAAYYDALAYRVLRRELHELLSRLVLHLLPVKGSAQDKLASLGRGREAFAHLERINAEELTPAALLVVVRDMRQALGMS
jgi:glutamate dehydrogenase